MLFGDMLNKEQMEAVLTTEGYLRVIASAGTGKTRALAYRFYYLHKELGISKENILSITFTNKAAKEMKDRIRTLISDSLNDYPYIQTIHSFSTYFLREQIYILGYPKNFKIIDENDRNELIKEIRNDFNIELSIKEIKKEISKYKKDLKYIDLLLNKSFSVDSYIDEYLQRQSRDFYLDFDDLINFTLYILERKKDILFKYQKKFNYIMVDEFQDISENQFEIIKLLSLKHKNLFIVGDPDQSIYGFAGAKIHLFIDFDKMFENVKTIEMNTNYRSSKEIVDVSNMLIKNNTIRYNKDMISHRGINGNNVVCYICKDTQKMQEEMATLILSLINRGYKYSEIAIIYRSNYLAREIEKALISKMIPYKIINGVEFYSRIEIKIVTSILHLAIFSDDLSFNYLRKNYRFGIGKKGMLKLNKLSHGSNLFNTLSNNCDYFSSITKQFVFRIMELKKYIEVEKMSSNIIKYIYNEFDIIGNYKDLGDEDRLENLYELLEYVIENEKETTYTIQDFIDEIALIAMADKETNIDGIRLLTAHSSKGLEFKNVIVYEMRENIFPNHKSVSTQTDLEAERRLAYVALTRAMDNLFLLTSLGFRYNDAYGQPSIFLHEIEKLVMFKGDFINDTFSKNRKSQNESNDKTHEKFIIGSVVRHQLFGIGFVLESDFEESLVDFANGKEIKINNKLLKLIDVPLNDENQNNNKIIINEPSMEEKKISSNKKKIYWLLIFLFFFILFKILLIIVK